MVADKNEKDLANQLLTEISEDQVSTKPASCFSWSPESVNGLTIPVLFFLFFEKKKTSDSSNYLFLRIIKIER